MKQLLAMLWDRWKKFARRLGEFQSRLLLTILYLILTGPVAMILRPFSDPLRLKTQKRDSYWLEREGAPSSLEEARRQ